jgi:hypothetical protein
LSDCDVGWLGEGIKKAACCPRLSHRIEMGEKRLTGRRDENGFTSEYITQYLVDFVIHMRLLSLENG